MQSVAVDEGTKRILFLMKGGEIQNRKYPLWRQKRSSESSLTLCYHHTVDDNRPRHLVIAAAAHHVYPIYLWMYVIVKKENQILCVQNLLILKFFILIDI